MFETLRNWIRSLSPTCREVTRLQSLVLDGHLSGRERLGVNLHLLLCRWCRRYGRQLRFLHEALRENEEKLGTCSHVQLPRETREQLKEMMSRNPD